MDKKAKIAAVAALVLVGILVASLAFAAKRECNDGIDNDGDGDIDLADAGCKNKGDNDETNCGDGVCEGGEDVGSCPADCTVQCNDGDDNDGDGHIDTGATGDSECVDSNDDDESPRDFCDDTDGGVDSDTQGTVSGEDDSTSFSETDFCLDSTNLREYYCGGKSSDYDPLTTDVNCQTNVTTSCSEGACV